MKTRHSDDKNNDNSFCERELESFYKTRSILVEKCRTENEDLAEASYNASYHISVNGEAHIIGESLL